MRLTSVIFCTIFMITVYSGSAQAGWLDKINDILSSPESKKTIESLSNSDAQNTLSNSDIAKGLREALNVGTAKVVGRLGATDGFNLDPNIHIPLPESLGRVGSALSKVGMGSMIDDLELRLNRAAEIATPKAKALFISSIQQMTFNDAKNILSGPNNAATEYLRNTMGSELSKEMEPLVNLALSEAGAIKAYDNVMGKYRKLPFMPDVKSNLKNYVVEKAMDGIFYYVAQEEAAIRTDPVARTTDILKKVFSAQ